MNLSEFLLEEIDKDKQELNASLVDDVPYWWMPSWMTKEKLLADLEAKRQIVELHSGFHLCSSEYGTSENECCYDLWPIAALYSDRQGFTWKNPNTQT